MMLHGYWSVLRQREIGFLIGLTSFASACIRSCSGSLPWTRRTAFTIPRHTAAKRRTTMTESNVGATTENDEVVMLGKYPYHFVQPTARMEEVFQENASRVRDALGDELVSIDRIGSSAIPGMPGTPVVDLLAVIKSYPPSERQLMALADRGFPDPMRNEVHAKDDTWFFGGAEDGCLPGHLGRVVLHVVGEGNPWISEALDFVRYVSSNQDAFDRYKAVKNEGAKLGFEGVEGEKLTTYKRAKHETVLQIKKEAKEWAARESK